MEIAGAFPLYCIITAAVPEISADKGMACNAGPDELLDNVWKAAGNIRWMFLSLTDLTILSLRYDGRIEMDQITVIAELEQVKTVTRFVNEHLVPLGCPERTRIQLDIAIDEIFSNIVHYAYTPETGQATIRFEVDENPRSVAITFIDHGVPFNPLAEERPDTTRLSKTNRPIGGLGLFMVQKTMDDISYEYIDGQNILTIRKII